MLFFLFSISFAAVITDINTCITTYGVGYKFCLKSDDSAGFCCDSLSKTETTVECSS